MSCKPNFSWFIACATNDIATVRLKRKKCVGQKDPRQQFLGLTGLMHAALNDAVEVFSYLLPLEHNISTSNEYQMQATGISDHATFMLSKESNIFHILVLRSLNKCFRVYQYFQQSQLYEALPNNMLITPLHLAAICGNVDVLQMQNVLKAEMCMQSHDGMTFLMYAAYFGKTEIIEFVLEIAKQYHILNNRKFFTTQKEIQEFNDYKVLYAKLQFVMLIKDNDQKTAMDFCFNVVDNEFVDVSDQEKKKCVLLMKELEQLM